MYGDYLIYSDAEENRILLNIGGIANLTWLPRGQDPAEVMSTDVGPGNTMMDALVQARYPGRRYDQDSALARRGRVSAALLEALQSNRFFDMPFPKTIGPELFNMNYLSAAQAASNTDDLSTEDLLATLCRFSADGVTEAIRRVAVGKSDVTVYASGGGIHNGLLIDNIRKALVHTDIHSTQKLGVDPDAKEAVVFAVLANECVAGNGIGLGAMASNDGTVTLGKLSFPS